MCGASRPSIAPGSIFAATHLLGTSGTVTTIAGLHLRLQRYDRRQVDGCWMIDEQVQARAR